MDVQGLLRALWRKKWILIIVPMIAGISAFAIRFFGEWKFVSVAQLATGLTHSDDLIEGARSLNPYEVQVAFNNLTEIIRSRSVLGQVSYRLMLHDLSNPDKAYEQVKDERLKDALKTDPTPHIPDFITILENKTDSLTLLNPNNPKHKLLQKYIEAHGYDYESVLKNLMVYRVNQSDFIELNYTSSNAQLSAFAVNSVCSEFLRYYSSSRATSSGSSLESLESIAKQRKDYLDSKVEELRAFKASNDLINSSVETDAKLQQIRDYEDQVADERQKIRGLELTIANMTNRIDDAEINAGLRPNDKVIALRKRINSVNERYVQGGQTDTKLLDSLTHLRTQLDIAMSKVNETSKVTPAELNTMKNKREETKVELQIARENLTSLTNIYNTIKYSIRDFANVEAKGEALEKEVEVASEEYLNAQNRLNDAKEKMLTSRMSISQILIAEPAEKAESRKTLIFMVFSGILSFMICAFVIVARELMDSRINNAQRFRQKTRLKLAGSLLKLPNVDQNWGEIFQSQSRQLPINEQVRKIRFELLNQKAKVFLVTSIKDSQGKSFFIVALAYSLSLLKKRTLIIDTNMRNNSLTRILLATPNLKRLVEHFATNTKRLKSHENDMPVEEEVNNVGAELISRTQNDFVDIIGNRTSQLSPSEIIPGGDFKVLLEWLKVTYDYIILEGPALNEFSDSKELVRFVDVVIPVFSADATVGGTDTDALNYLKSLGEKLGPAVLNNVQEIYA